MKDADKETLGKVLVERARAMRPALRERAAETDRNRRVSDETIAEFHRAGFFKILKPVAYGGYELPLQVMTDVTFEVASACGSTGWVLAILSIHQWDVQSLPAKTINDIWGDDPEALLSSAYASTGEVKAVEGGHMLNGRWPFSSGCDHARWAIVGGTLPPRAEGRPPVLQGFFVPRSDYEIIDDWHTMGMRGTGSKSLVLKNVFVPHHHQHPTMFSSVLGSADQPPLYRLPFLVVFREPLAATAYGIAQNALERFIERTKVRKDAFSGMRMADNPDYQHAVAEAEYAIRAARMLQNANLRATDEAVSRGEPLDPQHIGRFCSEATRSVRLCYEAISRLFVISGGNTLRDGDPLQLAFREIAGVATHPALDFNNYGRRYGAFVLNGPH